MLHRCVITDQFKKSLLIHRAFVNEYFVLVRYHVARVMGLFRGRGALALSARVVCGRSRNQAGLKSEIKLLRRTDSNLRR